MADHIVHSFDVELNTLRRSIAEMGGTAERMLVEATSALVRDDAALAQTVIAADRRLDDLQRDIEERAVLTIARRQPLAVDLREIVSALRIAGDLERAGDLAKNTAKRVIAMTGNMHPKRVVLGVQHMSDLALGQLKDVLDAYAGNDTALAVAVWTRDGAIDALNNSLFRELLTYMMEDPRSISFCTHLLFCAKNIERIGDHTTNIAETIHYLVTGEPLAAERPKDDRSSYAVVEPPAGERTA
ncbi:MAG TPA: phosphate signaling complex protein PhoU [Beijerinckiaceae bacterium]|jgi:phosphate transport system protein|nr:phosphate signaling complex protein PhoU [Beijerinckiaceae bacterium]